MSETLSVSPFRRRALNALSSHGHAVALARGRIALVRERPNVCTSEYSSSRNQPHTALAVALAAAAAIEELSNEQRVP